MEIKKLGKDRKETLLKPGTGYITVTNAFALEKYKFQIPFFSEGIHSM